MRSDAASASEAMMARFSVAEFAPRYAARATWRTRLIGQDRSPRVRDVVRSVAVNASGGECTVLLGPGFSYLATAVSPLIRIPWIDFSSTSVALSDKSLHPAFSRVIPPDDFLGTGMSNLMALFGWRRINVICSNEAYGRSITQQVASKFAVDHGGAIAGSACVEAGTSEEEAESVLVSVLSASPSRIVAVGAASSVLTPLLRAIIRRELWRSFVFVFSETVCSGDSVLWRELPGSLCLTYRENATRATALTERFRARETFAEDTAALDDVGHTNGVSAVRNDVTLFSLFAHDAVHHAMGAVDDALRDGHDVAAPFDAHSAGVSWLRSHVTANAVTGNVLRMNNRTGDRSEATFAVRSIAADGTVETVAVLQEELLYGRRVDDDDFQRGLPAVSWFGGGRSRVPPVDVLEDSLQFSVTLVAVAGGAVLVLILFIVGVCCARRHRDAVSRAMASDWPGEIANVLLTVTLVALKIATAIFIAEHDVHLKFLVPLCAFAGVGACTAAVDVSLRTAYVCKLLASDDGLIAIDVERKIKARVQKASVATLLLSNMPAAVLCAILVALSVNDVEEADGMDNATVGMALAVAFGCSFAAGLKASMIPPVIRSLCGRERSAMPHDESASDIDSHDTIARRPKAGVSDDAGLEEEGAPFPGRTIISVMSGPLPPRGDEDDVDGLPAKGDVASQRGASESPGPRRPEDLHSNGHAALSRSADPSPSQRTAARRALKLERLATGMAASLYTERVPPWDVVRVVMPGLLRDMGIEDASTRESLIREAAEAPPSVDNA